MAKIPTDDQGVPFHYRPGTDPFGSAGWRGINTESDPGSLDPNELQWAEDVRFHGKGIRTRYGMRLKTDFGNAAAGQSVMWMHEAPVDNPYVRLWGVTLGCFGTAIGTGSTIFHVDPSQTPVQQDYTYYFTASDFQCALGRYGDKLFVGDRSELREIVLVTAPRGDEAASIMLSPSNVATGSFPGYSIRCIREFDSKLFIGLEDLAAPASSKIVAWDGQAFVDDITGIRPPLAFGLWQDKLVAGFDATAGNIQVRNIGAAPGTWNAFAVGGFQCGTGGNVMQEYKQYIYIASGAGDIFRFDGAALSNVRNIATADTTGVGVTSLALHQEVLFYGWNVAASFVPRLGRHDLDSTATPYEDTYKNISTDFPALQAIGSLASYRQQLYMGGGVSWVLTTAMNDVKGTAVAIADNGAGTSFRVATLLRFP